MKLSDLIPDKRNANKGTKRGAAMLEESLKNYGAGRSILADKKGRIIAGNKTLEAAGNIGLDDVVLVKTDGSKLVVVQRTDMDLAKDQKAKELAIADNRASEVSLEWDGGALESLASEVDLSRFFTDGELSKLLPGGFGGSAEAPEAKIDKAEELQKKWKTARGQIWEIGRHRLMCGDSGTSDVAALFGDVKAWLIATDPPYGVGFGVSSGPDSAKRFTAIAGDEADGPRLQSFLEGVFKAALPFLHSGAAWYLWHAQMTQGFFAAAAAAAAAQVKVHRQIIWAKSHLILGHGDYHWQHELCFYGWREGERHRWFGDRSQTTLWAVENPRAHEHHPTEKPVELFARPMRFNTERGDICYEPFAGSGTQLCAAEITGRACYGMEIEPKYVAVTLERMADMGLTPKLTNGKTSEQQRKQETAHPARGRKEIPVQARAKRQPRRSAKEDAAHGRLHGTACAASA